MTLGVSQIPNLRPHQFDDNKKKLQKNLRRTSRKGMSLACVPRAQFLVPSISSLLPLISLFAATVHDGVGNRALIARDNTAQPKQRLANQGKTTVLLHDFFLASGLSPCPPHNHTLSGIRESWGAVMSHCVSLLLAAVHGAPSNFLRCVPARSLDTEQMWLQCGGGKKTGVWLDSVGYAANFPVGV